MPRRVVIARQSLSDECAVPDGYKGQPALSVLLVSQPLSGGRVSACVDAQQKLRLIMCVSLGASAAGGWHDQWEQWEYHKHRQACISLVCLRLFQDSPVPLSIEVSKASTVV
ncbi:hypothetical protein HaLaN_32954 [Haematococcus lacustris]|uniref:Uncharacterized protein n=1 Tax=Haematococcus lacustris TaxID=44745 RepID=A0A6A0ANX2_HAELA|nr:hypothetical protein HaLaN_32954 [Haematococcus lacustris]